MKIDSLPTKRVLTLEAARKIADMALAEAIKRGFNQLVIVVVDDGGRLLFLLRQDDAEPAAVDIGIAKARTAAIFKKATKEWKEKLLAGNNWVLGMPNMTPVEGGIPIIVEQRVIGAIGIAGAKGSADTEIGLASLTIFQDGQA
jgi:glc operon protein GlcG